MTAKKAVIKPVGKQVVGYVIFECCEDGDYDDASSITLNEIELVDNNLYAKDDLDYALKQYDGGHQLFVGEVRISHITVRALKEV